MNAPKNEDGKFWVGGAHCVPLYTTRLRTIRRPHSHLQQGQDITQHDIDKNNTKYYTQSPSLHLGLHITDIKCYAKAYYLLLQIQRIVDVLLTVLIHVTER